MSWLTVLVGRLAVTQVVRRRVAFTSGKYRIRSTEPIPTVAFSAAVGLHPQEAMDGGAVTGI